MKPRPCRRADLQHATAGFVVMPSADLGASLPRLMEV